MFADVVFTIFGMIIFALMVILIKKIIKTITRAFTTKKTITNDASTQTSTKFPQTEKERELSIQFAKHCKTQIKEHVLPFQRCFDLANKETDLDKKIELLQRTILLFEEAKTWFYKTKGGTIYFQTAYENLRNAQCEECFSFGDMVKTRMEYYIRKRDYLIPMILGTISSNVEGILQKDIYKQIPDASKSEIQHTICELEAEGKITKEKSGNSYLLNIK